MANGKAARKTGWKREDRNIVSLAPAMQDADHQDVDVRMVPKSVFLPFHLPLGTVIRVRKEWAVAQGCAS